MTEPTLLGVSPEGPADESGDWWPQRETPR